LLVFLFQFRKDAVIVGLASCNEVVEDSGQSVCSSGDSIWRADARTEAAMVIAKGGKTLDERLSGHPQCLREAIFGRPNAPYISLRYS
jgi:hypothetical protein